MGARHTLRFALRLAGPDLCIFCHEPVALEDCNTEDGFAVDEECYLAEICTTSPRKPVQSAGPSRIWSYPLNPTA